MRYFLHFLNNEVHFTRKTLSICILAYRWKKNIFFSELYKMFIDNQKVNAIFGLF